MGAMDERSSTRYVTDLEALVHPSVGKSWLCTIKDFCDEGMLLVEQEGKRSPRGKSGINTGDLVEVHFSVPLENQDDHFHFKGKIVRVMDSGVGINFPQAVDPKAFEALTIFSEKMQGSPQTKKKIAAVKKPQKEQSAAPKQPVCDEEKPPVIAELPATPTCLKPSDCKKIVAAIRKGVVKLLSEMTLTFFTYMDAVLLELAKDAKSNEEQDKYFAVMADLEKHKKAVFQQFKHEVLDQLDNPRDLQTLQAERKKIVAERKKTSSPTEMELLPVNSEIFDDWLAVASIISRSEKRYEKYHQELFARMGMIVESWAHNEVNPIGSAVFCHAFDDAIQNIGVSTDIRQEIYTAYEAKITPLLNKLYVGATKMLEKSGLFPELGEEFVTPSSLMTERRLSLAGEATQKTSTEAGETSSEGKDLSGQDDEHQAGSKSRSDEQGVTNAEPAAGNITLSEVYATVRGLLCPPTDSDDDVADESVIGLDGLLDLLQSLQQEVGTGARQRMPVKQRILEGALSAGGERQLSPLALERLDVVENLVDSIDADLILSDSAKGWIRQLELTLYKVAAQHRDFLDQENQHSSLDVINQLARLGGAESGDIRDNIEDIIGEINRNYDADPAAFDSALTTLHPLIEQQSRAFADNMQKTVMASERNQSQLSAQRVVADEMFKLLAGSEVSEVFMQLLVPGWRDLLVNTHIEQGVESIDWKNYKRALEQMMSHLDASVDPKESPYYIPPDELLGQIESGLKMISLDVNEMVPLVNTLRRLITYDKGKEPLPVVAMSEQSVLDALGFSNVDEEEEKRRPIQARNKDNDDWMIQLDRVQHLHVGEWIEFISDSEEAEIAIVAWINASRTSMVFVDRLGIKINELMVEELAAMVIAGTARIFEESDITLTERASHHMLQRMHNELTYQATHDAQTGLVNRKEFINQLSRVFHLAKRKKTHHVVAIMAVDQVEIINSKGGHGGGDKLFVGLSELIKDAIPEFTILSRLRHDEFGFLLEDCSKEAGLHVIRHLTEVVKAFQFEWRRESFPLTTSCGVVNFNEEADSIDYILKGAGAACEMAKAAGRDTIETYKSDDSDLVHRIDIMEFVSQIDKSLAEDRFVLNCQLITPLFERAQEKPQYEILLTVLDGNDEPMPPQDFITAAESSNRMGAIDRWVIEHAFRFIADNYLRLQHVGVFTINISGNSLTEDDFMEFVLEQFRVTRLPTAKICFEITEKAAIGNLDGVIEFVEKMQVLGVRFSLDDFGKDLSSYSYLRDLPVDYLKIDGSFVKEIKTSPSDFAVVKSINEIGHFMGKQTVAEFVEDEEVLAILKEIGVDFAQGFGVGKKIPITEILD